MIGAYKVADMYKNGYFVQKDEARYKEIIENLYSVIKDTDDLFDPLPEIFTRLANIRAAEGDTAGAINLFEKARDFLEKRIRIDGFFGNLSIMKGLILDTYKICAFDPDFIGLYDLYYLLRSPAVVSFRFEDSEHIAEAVKDEEGVRVFFDGNDLGDADGFFKDAVIDGKPLTVIYDELYDFTVDT